MIKIKDTAEKLIKEAEKILEEIKELKTPSLSLQENIKDILLKLKTYAQEKKKTVVAQKIEQVLNELSKVSSPSLFIQKELAKDALNLFVKNFDKK
jgi:seryl-tRNA synthetase